MVTREKFIFTIYKSPVVITMAVNGKARFLREQAFLDQFLGRFTSSCDGKPEPGENFYVLEEEQFVAYLDFRRQMRVEFGESER